MYRIPSRMHMYSMQTYISAGIIRILIAFQQFLTLCMYCILYVCVLRTVKILIIPLSAAKSNTHISAISISSNCVYSFPVFTWLKLIYCTRIYTDKSSLIPLFVLFQFTALKHPWVLNIGYFWSEISKVYLGSMCTAVLIGWDPATPPPPTPGIWAHIRGRYWSAKTDDISWRPHVFKFNIQC
jgi:hypothetical protein